MNIIIWGLKKEEREREYKDYTMKDKLIFLKYDIGRFLGDFKRLRIDFCRKLLCWRKVVHDPITQISDEPTNDLLIGNVGFDS